VFDYMEDAFAAGVRSQKEKQENSND
jgi:hypothetical protein